MKNLNLFYHMDFLCGCFEREKRIVNVCFTQKVSGCGSWRKQQYEIIQYRRSGGHGSVMMRNADKYAVAVRKTDGEIVVKTEEYKGIVQNKKYVLFRSYEVCSAL